MCIRDRCYNKRKVPAGAAAPVVWIERQENNMHISYKPLWHTPVSYTHLDVYKRQVHIVINSLRIEEVPFLPYMDRPADTKAGCKHLSLIHI